MGVVVYNTPQHHGCNVGGTAVPQKPQDTAIIYRTRPNDPHESGVLMPDVDA